MPPETAAARGAGPPPPASAWRRLWPLGVLLAALAAAYVTGLHRLLGFDSLAANRAALLALAAENPVLTAAGFVLAYVAVVAFSVPGGAVMSLAAGFLFGHLLGAVLAVVGATVGACLLFLAARYALGEALAARGGPLLARLREELRRDGFWYLLSLRLVPVVPFWLTNLAPALAGVPFRAYALATAIGIVPGTAVFAGIGAGLGQVFDEGGRPDLDVVFRPGILLPLLGLAALSLLGALWRRRARRRAGADRPADPH